MAHSSLKKDITNQYMDWAQGLEEYLEQEQEQELEQEQEGGVK